MRSIALIDVNSFYASCERVFNPQLEGNLMNVLDEINRKMGKQCIRIASQGYKQPWAMKQELKSKSYTTKWEEILLVK